MESQRSWLFGPQEKAYTRLCVAEAAYGVSLKFWLSIEKGEDNLAHYTLMCAGSGLPFESVREDMGLASCEIDTGVMYALPLALEVCLDQVIAVIEDGHPL